MAKRTNKRKTHAKNDAAMIEHLNEKNYREHRYFRRFESLALSRIKWEGLPETMDERFLEKTLLYSGRAVIYDASEGSDPENPIILGTRGTPNGPMDLYDNQSKWISIGNGGHYQQIPEGEAIVVWDSKTRKSIGEILIETAREVAELETIARINRRQQRWAKILKGPQEAQTDMMRLREHLETGDPFMMQIKSIEGLTAEVETLDLSTPYLVDDFDKDRLNIFNNLMIDLGIKTQPFEKSQYQHLEEVTIANDEIARVREDLLAPRRFAADLMNEKWGLNVTVDWANDEFEVLDLVHPLPPLGESLKEKKMTNFYENDEIEDTIFNGQYATTFGELLITGWDWGRDDWTSWTMKPEIIEIVRPRINEKIEERYFMRELNVPIPGQWKLLMKSKMSEIMDEIGPQYNEVAEGIDLSGVTFTQSRHVESDYPQAQLQPDRKDYASSATEHGSETVSSAATLDAIMKFRAAAIAPDNEVLNRVDVMFSHTPYFL